MAARSKSALLLFCVLSCLFMLLVTNVTKAEGGSHLPVCGNKEGCGGTWCKDEKRPDAEFKGSDKGGGQKFYKKAINEFLDPLAHTHFTTEPPSGTLSGDLMVRLCRNPLNSEERSLLVKMSAYCIAKGMWSTLT
ncbi:hypothetical protein YC2023_074199 [Brassica napus]